MATALDFTNTLSTLLLGKVPELWQIQGGIGGMSPCHSPILHFSSPFLPVALICCTAPPPPDNPGSAPAKSYIRCIYCHRLANTLVTLLSRTFSESYIPCIYWHRLFNTLATLLSRTFSESYIPCIYCHRLANTLVTLLSWYRHTELHPLHILP